MPKKNLVLSTDDKARILDDLGGISLSIDRGAWKADFCVASVTCLSDQGSRLGIPTGSGDTVELAIERLWEMCTLVLAWSAGQHLLDADPPTLQITDDRNNRLVRWSGWSFRQLPPPAR